MIIVILVQSNVYSLFLNNLNSLDEFEKWYDEYFLNKGHLSCV